LKVPTEEAERLKRLHGIAPDPSDPEGQAVSAGVMELVTDLLVSLRNTITYYSNTRPSEPVTGIILSGGGSQLPGFASAVSDFTRIGVTIGDPFLSIALARTLDPQKLRSDQAAISVALGLAMGSEAA